MFNDHRNRQSRGLKVDPPASLLSVIYRPILINRTTLASGLLVLP